MEKTLGKETVLDEQEKIIGSFLISHITPFGTHQASGYFTRYGQRIRVQCENYDIPAARLWHVRPLLLVTQQLTFFS